MALRLADLKKDYIAPDGSVVPVIEIAELSVGDGEHVALIGTSGSGKTTLLHMIAGIVAADSGSIIYDLPKEGQIDITKLSEAQRDVFRGAHVGYIFQTHHLLGGFTALENVLLGMS